MRRHITTLLSLATLTVPGITQTERFTEYLPLHPNYAWHFTNPNDPNDTYTWRVTTRYPFQHQGYSMRLNTGSDDWIVMNDGQAVSLLGSVDASGTATDLVPDIVLCGVTDDMVVPVGPTEYVVLRRWDRLDHQQQPAGYVLAPTEPNVVLWVWYDTNYRANAQSSFLQTNGAFHDDAVTDVDFFRKGEGWLAQLGVEARTGNLETWYDAVPVQHDCNGNGLPDHLDIAMGQATDCNRNGVPDTCDIAFGLSADVDRNGRPDECDVALTASACTTSLAAPSAIQIDLQATPSHAGETYLLLMSGTGTWPGLPLGAYRLPLEFDEFLRFTLTSPGTLIPNSFGSLSPTGSASTTLLLPLGLHPSAIGIRLEQAYGLLDLRNLQVLGVSNPVSIVIHA